MLIGAWLPSTAALGQAQRGAQQRQQAQQQQRQTQQQRRAQQTQQRSEQSIRTGDGMLAVSASLPAEIRTGEQFTYNVTVQNTTDDVTLHDIQLRHTQPTGLTIDSINQEGEAGQQQQGQQQQRRQQQQGQQQQGQQQQGQQQRGQQQDQEPQPQQPRPVQERQDEQGRQQQQQQGQQQQGGQDGQMLSIEQLGPGESRTFLVTVTADQEGPVDACLIVDSYKPAICLQTRAVRPELNLVKTAPDRNRLCDIIELTYTVTNDGTGSLGQFEIIDELAEGLRTIDGQDRLAFTVDQLEAGETRQFVASVYATRTGQFSSRAEARATQADLTSRSDSVGPEVVGADLQVTLDGRDAVASNTPVVFTATVTNTGNAPADDVQVFVRIPETASLRRVSDVRLTRDGQQQRNQQQMPPQAALQIDNREPAVDQYYLTAQQQTAQQDTAPEAGDEQQLTAQQEAEQQQGNQQQTGQQQRDQQTRQQRRNQQQQIEQQQQDDDLSGVAEATLQAGVAFPADDSGQQSGQQQAGQQQAGQQQAGQQQHNQQQQADQQRGQQQQAGRQQQQTDQQWQREQQQQQEFQTPMREAQMSIGRLEPGQSARFDYVVATRGMDEIDSQVEALYVCAIDVVDDAAQASASAQAMATTRIIRLPGLQVYVLDDVDPVATDQQVTYTIRVKNEGDAPDQDVRVTAMMPEQLEFVSAEGPTEHQQQDGQITFEPIQELAPGEELEFLVTATAVQEGSVRMQVDVDSQALGSTVRTEEPTQLFEGQGPN
jgi:uncharacterized repeat protein (TIGR01451 family)